MNDDEASALATRHPELHQSLRFHSPSPRKFRMSLTIALVHARFEKSELKDGEFRLLVRAQLVNTRVLKYAIG